MVGLEWYPCCRLQPDTELVLYSSTITMMHGPINIRFHNTCFLASRQIYNLINHMCTC